MAEGPQQINRHVVLPWAQTFDAEEQYDQAAKQRVLEDAFSIKSSASRFSLSDSIAVLGQSKKTKKELLTPELRAVGLPARPAPSIPLEDRAPALDTEDLVSAAVALDVLASATRRLESSADVLDGLTAALLRVGKMGGIGPAQIKRLLSHAGSPAGQDRALLSRRLAECMDPEPVLAEVSERRSRGRADPSTPTTVAGAARKVERCSELAVREAYLLLEAHEPVEYRQA